MIVAFVLFAALLGAWLFCEVQGKPAILRIGLGLAVAGVGLVVAFFAGGIERGYAIERYHAAIRLSDTALRKGDCDAVKDAFGEYLDRGGDSAGVISQKLHWYVQYQ